LLEQPLISTAENLRENVWNHGGCDPLRGRQTGAGARPVSRLVAFERKREILAWPPWRPAPRS
jgi:hypothetical protein